MKKTIIISTISITFLSLFLLFPVYSSNIINKNEQQSVIVIDLPIDNREVKIISLGEEPSDIVAIKNSFTIGDLFVLDNLFDTNSKSNYLSETTSLGDLFVINELFNDYELGSLNNQYSLGDLFVLDQLFNLNESNLLDSGETSLSDLFILDRLFNN